MFCKSGANQGATIYTEGGGGSYLSNIHAQYLIQLGCTFKSFLLFAL